VESLRGKYEEICKAVLFLVEKIRDDGSSSLPKSMTSLKGVLNSVSLLSQLLLFMVRRALRLHGHCLISREEAVARI
jgi:hypothetical protein